MDVKEGIESLKDEDGRDTTDLGKITCILNKYFATAGVATNFERWEPAGLLTCNL